MSGIHRADWTGTFEVEGALTSTPTRPRMHVCTHASAKFSFGGVGVSVVSKHHSDDVIAYLSTFMHVLASFQADFKSKFRLNLALFFFTKLTRRISAITPNFPPLRRTGFGLLCFLGDTRPLVLIQGPWQVPLLKAAINLEV